MSSAILEQPLPPQRQAFRNIQTRIIYENEIYASLQAHRTLANSLAERLTRCKERLSRLSVQVKTLEYENERRRRQVSRLEWGHMTQVWTRIRVMGIRTVIVVFGAAVLGWSVGDVVSLNAKSMYFGSAVATFIAWFFTEGFVHEDTTIRIMESVIWMLIVGFSFFIVGAMLENRSLFFVIGAVGTFSAREIMAARERRKKVDENFGVAYRRRSSQLSPLGPSRRIS